jgi:hypothetical protein
MKDKNNVTLNIDRLINNCLLFSEMDKVVITQYSKEIIEKKNYEEYTNIQSLYERIDES